MSVDNEGRFGTVHLETCDEETAVDVRPQHYEAESNKVDFNIYVGSLNTKLELSPRRAREIAAELTAAAAAADNDDTELGDREVSKILRAAERITDPTGPLLGQRDLPEVALLSNTISTTVDRIKGESDV